MTANIVQQGDIIYLDFNPQPSQKQKGRRPAIEISNNIFIALSRGALACPMTNTNRKIPLHVPPDNRTNTNGVIMYDQVKASGMIRIAKRLICHLT